MNPDRIQGMMLGIGIGDALGMPVETWTPERILGKYPEGVKKYEVPDGHKWFHGEPAGSTTDDTQLSIAVAEALLVGAYSMKVHKEHHVAALKQSDKGWGRTTREAVRAAANNSIFAQDAASGVGNGVAMKISPLAIPRYQYPTLQDMTDLFIQELCCFTHPTSIALSSAFAQVEAVQYCFESSPETFDPLTFIDRIKVASEHGNAALPDEIQDDMTASFEKLKNYKDFTQEDMIREFGGGSCYCFHSLPFTYAHFLKNPTSIDSMYKVVNAGGDTDSNGSILGAMLGALNGTQIFPEHLVNGLLDREKLVYISERLSAKFIGDFRGP